MQADKKASTQTKRSAGMATINPKANYYQQASDRLLFRAINIDDLAAWLEFINEDDYQRFLGQNLSLPRKTRARNWIEKQIERMSDNEFGQLAIIEKSSGNLIGLGGIITREINSTIEYEITYSLISRYWGKGYATELARHFRDFSKGNLPIGSVISMIHPENSSSIRVAEKNGMILDGEHLFFEMPVLVYRCVFSQSH